MTDMHNGQQTIVTGAYTDGAAFTVDSGSIVYGSTNAVSTNITLYSISAGDRTVVCTNCWNPQASADGRFVAYQTPDQVEIKDLLTGITTLISRNI